jgi:hypothetical protein
MIKALFLIFNPGATWDRIVRARKTFVSVLVLYLLPLAVLSIGGEMWGLLQWGRRQEFTHLLKPIPRELAISYGAAQFVLSMVFVFTGALVVKGAGETFHSRHTYLQCFTLVAYTLSPLFLIRLLDGYPLLSPWLTFGVGITLSIAALYSGIPRVMEPDPPHAFGLFFTGAVLLVIIGGLTRLLTLLVLQGRLKLH